MMNDPLVHNNTAILIRELDRSLKKNKSNCAAETRRYERLVMSVLLWLAVSRQLDAGSNKSNSLVFEGQINNVDELLLHSIANPTAIDNSEMIASTEKLPELVLAEKGELHTDEHQAVMDSDATASVADPSLDEPQLESTQSSEESSGGDSSIYLYAILIPLALAAIGGLAFAFAGGGGGSGSSSDDGAGSGVSPSSGDMDPTIIDEAEPPPTVIPEPDPPIVNEPSGSENTILHTQRNDEITIDITEAASELDEESLEVIAVVMDETPDGSVTLNPDNTVTYTPNDQFIGEDSFIVTVQDATGNQLTETVNVAVGLSHLAVMNVFPVWSDFTGTGIDVVILDSAFHYTHPDLINNYDTDRDFDFRNNDSDSHSNNTVEHGTWVAGVIAADDNGLGAMGVAFDATITGFAGLTGGQILTSDFIEAFNQITEFDVSNNSWSFSVGGPFTDNFKDSGFSGIAAELFDAAQFGRAGLGTIVVFSGGNSRDEGSNVNYHNFQNSKYTIAVSAVNTDGTLYSNSNPGAALLVSAVGGAGLQGGGSLFTTSGVDDYSFVSGTSFAGASVSGIVALILDANPFLGYRDVQEILAYSAIQTDPELPGWEFNGADNWNGGGLHFSHDFGFGLVDALAAVRLAESWTLQSTFENQKIVSVTSSPNVLIPDDQLSALISTVNVSDSSGIRIDHVEVDVNISQANISDLQLILTSPDGTQSLLLDHPDSDLSEIDFVFDTTQDWGELGEGQWSLQVFDDQDSNGSQALFNSWTIRLVGDELTDDDVYVYTNEFANFADDAIRTLLSDTSGIDTINAAAVTSDSTIDLSGTVVSQIAGVDLTIQAGTVIENVYSGDGNDIIIGNAGNNILFPGRGDDQLTGGLGADIFVSFKRGGKDSIEDFEPGLDILDISAHDIPGSTPQEQFNSLEINVVDGNSLIDFGSGDELLVMNTVDLEETNFFF